MANSSEQYLYDRVMVVDDRKTDARIHRRVLYKNHFAETIDVFLDPQEALRSVRHELSEKEPSLWPEFLFLDLEMPRIDGHTFIQEIDRVLPESEKEQLSVYILSGYPKKEAPSLVDQHPFVDGWIQKPLTAEKLQRVK